MSSGRFEDLAADGQHKVNLLQLLGKSVYPLWDAALRATLPAADADKLFRYRITMSGCIVFCIYGVGLLLFRGKAMRDFKTTPPPSSSSGRFASPCPSPTAAVPTTRTLRALSKLSTTCQNCVAAA